MIANEATHVRQVFLQRLAEVNLSTVLRQDMSQFLDMEDYVFVEAVLSDGGELERVEGIIVALSEALRGRKRRA